MEEDKGADTDAGRLMRAVMAQVGAANPTDLSKILGPPWTERDQQRKLYKWWRGKSAPNFDGTITLIRAAGWLNMQQDVNALPAADPDPLGSIATGVRRLLDGQAELLAEVQKERGRAQPQPRRAAPKQTSS